MYSFVTVTYNSVSHINEFLRCFKHLDEVPWQLIVVDNASIDSTVKEIEQSKVYLEFSDRIHILEHSLNIGVAAANNVGIDFICDLGLTNKNKIIFLNNDITFDRSITKLLCGRQAILSPAIYDGFTKSIWYGGGSINKTRFMSVEHVTDLIVPGVNETGYAPTTFLSVELDVLRKVGKFHEQFFCYYDDADWILRARNAGYRVYVDGRVTIQHFEGSSSGGNRSPFSLYYLTRNRLMFISRHSNKTYLSLAIIFLSVFIIASSAREKNKINYLYNRFRGFLDFIRGR